VESGNRAADLNSASHLQGRAMSTYPSYNQGYGVSRRDFEASVETNSPSRYIPNSASRQEFVHSMNSRNSQLSQFSQRDITPRSHNEPSHR
jgi:hypothetical protein